MNLLSTILLLAASSWAMASAPGSRKYSAEFERMKALVGTWEGETDIGQGPVDLRVEYRLLAGNELK